MREDSKQEHGTEYSQASDGPAENQDEDTEKMTESSRADTEDVATDFETGSDSSSDSGNSSGDNSTFETTASSEETGTVEIGDRKTGKLWLPSGLPLICLPARMAARFMKSSIRVSKAGMISTFAIP